MLKLRQVKLAVTMAAVMLEGSQASNAFLNPLMAPM